MKKTRVRTIVFNVVAAIVFFSATGFAAAQVFATNDVMSGKPSSSLCPDCHAICGTLGGFVVPGRGCNCCLPPS